MKVGHLHPAVRGHRADRHAGQVGADHRRAVRGRRHHQRRGHQGPHGPVRRRRQGRGGVPGGDQGVVERDRLLRRRRAGERQRRRVHQGAGPEDRPRLRNGRSTSSATASAGGWPTASPAPTPALFDGMAAVKADPMPGLRGHEADERHRVLRARRHVGPLQAREKGKETPPATVQIARLQKDMGCESRPAVVKNGTVTYRSLVRLRQRASAWPGRYGRRAVTTSRRRPPIRPAPTSSSGPSSARPARALPR